jgi:hypothetical protein
MIHVLHTCGRQRSISVRYGTFPLAPTMLPPPVISAMRCCLNMLRDFSAASRAALSLGTTAHSSPACTDKQSRQAWQASLERVVPAITGHWQDKRSSTCSSTYLLPSGQDFTAHLVQGYAVQMQHKASVASVNLAVHNRSATLGLTTGHEPRPIICTAMEGPALSSGFPRSSFRVRTRP